MDEKKKERHKSSLDKLGESGENLDTKPTTISHK